MFNASKYENIIILKNRKINYYIYILFVYNNYITSISNYIYIYIYIYLAACVAQWLRRRTHKQ